MDRTTVILNHIMMVNNHKQQQYIIYPSLTTNNNNKVSHLSIRQVALVANNLEENIKRLSSWLQVKNDGFKDPHIHSLGLKNTVLCLQGTFLETVTPLTTDNTASKQLKRRQGDGGYMVMLQTPPNLLSEDVKRLRDKFKVVFEVNHKELDEIHLHPKDTNKCIFSITETRPASSWRWGGPTWERDASQIGKISGAVLQVDILNDDCIQRFSHLLNCSPSVVQLGKQAVFSLAQGQRIRIILATDGRGDGLHGFELYMTDRAKAGVMISMCGVVIYCM
jgi:hypothetical protein